MCGLRPPITAAVVTPLLPDPPVTGGQKRTLRLLEAMERAGLHPHLLTADPGAPGAAERLRARGWEVDVIARAARRACWSGLRQHASRLPSPLLHQLAGPLRGGGVARGDGPVRAHPERVLRGAAPGVPSVLSLHNLDSAVARSSARQRSGLAWVREQNRAAALRVVERRVLPLADRVLCVSEADADAVFAAGGRALLAPNGVDDEFFLTPLSDAGERALFFGHFGYEANRRGVERFLAEGWPDGPARCARARGWRSPGGGMDDALRARLAAVEGVEVLGPGRRPAGRAGRGAGRRRPDLGGRRDAAEGARGAGRRAGRGGDVARRLRSRVRRRPARAARRAPRGAGGGARVTLLADPQRAAAMGAEGRVLAERYRWPEALAGASALYSQVVARQRADK